MPTDTKKQWRAKYRSQQTHALRRDRRRMRLRHVTFVQWLRIGICLDCREFDTDRVFNHLRGPKLFDIGSHLRRGLSWAQLMEEIMKCELVCPDCHTKRTRSRGSQWRPGDPETPF